MEGMPLQVEPDKNLLQVFAVHIPGEYPVVALRHKFSAAGDPFQTVQTEKLPSLFIPFRSNLVDLYVHCFPPFGSWIRLYFTPSPREIWQPQRRGS